MIKGLNGKLKRGDIIWFHNRNQYSEHVQKGDRPAIILQNNDGNFMSSTYIIAMITTKVKCMHLPIHVIVESVGLSRRSTVMLNQILTIDERDILEYVGPMPSHYLKEIEKACMVSLDLKPTLAEPIKTYLPAPKIKAEAVVYGNRKLKKEILGADLMTAFKSANRFKIKDIYLDGQDAQYVIQNDQLTVHYGDNEIYVPLSNLHILTDELSEIQKF